MARKTAAPKDAPGSDATGSSAPSSSSRRSDTPRSDVRKSKARKAEARESSAPVSETHRSSVPAPVGSVALQPEDRQRMIAERAYLRAESRGFQGGDAVVDWLEAEQEVERFFGRAAQGTRNRRNEPSEQIED